MRRRCPSWYRIDDRTGSPKGDLSRYPNPCISMVSDSYPAQNATKSLKASVCAYAFANFWVHSLAVSMAALSSSFHRCATSFAKGSSGFGAPSNACIERRIVRIWRAGDQLPVLISHGPRWEPACLTLQDVQAYPAQLVDIWMIDLGEESNLRWCHRVVVWQEKLEPENAR